MNNNTKVLGRVILQNMGMFKGHIKLNIALILLICQVKQIKRLKDTQKNQMFAANWPSHLQYVYLPLEDLTI